MKLLSICFVLFSVTLAVYSQSSGNGNAMVDQLLKIATTKMLDKLDPFFLENITADFVAKPLFITYRGQLRLHHGWMTGMKTLHRRDDAKMTVLPGNGTLISAKLGVNNVTINTLADVKVMGMRSTVHALAQVQYVLVDQDVHVGRDGRGRLLRFKLVELQGLTVSITGLGLMQWLANTLISSAQVLFRKEIRSALEVQLKGLISEQLLKIRLPV